MASAEDGQGACKVGAKSVFGKLSDAELIAKVKGLALDPLSSEYSRSEVRAVVKQTARVRKAMALASVNFPRRKRKLELLLKENSRSGLSDQQGKSKVSKGLNSPKASPASFLRTSGEAPERPGGKIGLDSHSLYDQLTYDDDDMDVAKNCSVISFTDSDESANSQNLDSPENAVSREKVPSKSRGQGTPTLQKMHLRDKVPDSPKKVVSQEKVPSNSRSQGTPTKKHFQPPRRSARSLDIVCDDTQRSVIPVGPRFQADIPEWIGPEKAQDIVYKHETSKWTSHRVWPCEVERKERVPRSPGQGRSNECSHCLNPGSIDCVQRHVVEGRLLLLCELGSAFFRMRLDVHGEQIAKTWTEEEQRLFQSLATKKPMHDDGKDFLKHAFKSFPGKCRKAIMSYYFNVYLPRHMGQMTRASKKLDTDDEAEEEVICSAKTPQGEAGDSGSKSSKNRFLRQ